MIGPFPDVRQIVKGVMTFALCGMEMPVDHCAENQIEWVHHRGTDGADIDGVIVQTIVIGQYLPGQAGKGWGRLNFGGQNFRFLYVMKCV